MSNNVTTVRIEEFISPTIIERLESSESLLKVKIPDFKSLIDVVLVDFDYDDKVFNTRFSDVPEKKADLVRGSYEIKIPEKRTKIAVRVIDMLGEEVLFSKDV